MLYCKKSDKKERKQQTEIYFPFIHHNIVIYVPNFPFKITPTTKQWHINCKQLYAQTHTHRQTEMGEGCWRMKIISMGKISSYEKHLNC